MSCMAPPVTALREFALLSNVPVPTMAGVRASTAGMYSTPPLLSAIRAT